MSKLYDALADLANARQLLTDAELRRKAEQDAAAEWVAAKAAAFDARRKMDQLPKTPTRAEVSLAVGEMTKGANDG